MKNATRKLLSLVMALAMVMSLSIASFAAEITTGTLKVTGNELGGKKVTAVLMFTANVKDAGGDEGDGLIGEGDSIGYELVAAWQGFIDHQMNLADDKDATSEEAYNYVKDLTGSALISFAEAAKNYAKANQIANVTVTADATTDTATLSNLTAGYYVVYPQAGSTSTTRGTEAMLVNVPSQAATELKLKSVYPTVDKVVDADADNKYNEAESAQIGETVKFQLSADVPEMSDYKTYQFNFVDTLSDGLTYVADSVTVTIGGETVTPSEVSYENNVLRVEFANLKGIEGVTAGEKILVTYSALVNGNAKVGKNVNTVEVEYSNDPDWDGEGTEPTGTTDEDEAAVYTFEIVVDKYTGEYGENAERLSGAVFQLKDSKGNVLKLIAEEENSYRIATADESTEITQVTTDANGYVSIHGLEAGTYLLEEIAAPTGYNKLAEDVTITISMESDENQVIATSQTVPVQNKTGAVLPDTGAMGTIGLTLFGVAVVILGIALPRKKNGRA